MFSFNSGSIVLTQLDAVQQSFSLLFHDIALISGTWILSLGTQYDVLSVVGDHGLLSQLVNAFSRYELVSQKRTD